MKEKFSFSQFQKLGKVLMTPVMIMPIAGILVGVGSAFTTKNIVELMPFLGTTYVKLFFNLLKAMGNTVNSYLPIIFAVSVAVGYAKKEKGIAACGRLAGGLPGAAVRLRGLPGYRVYRRQEMPLPAKSDYRHAVYAV